MKNTDPFLKIRCKECGRVPWAHHHECSIGFRQEIKDRQIDQELISKGKEAIHDFEEKGLMVHPKKRKHAASSKDKTSQRKTRLS